MYRCHVHVIPADKISRFGRCQMVRSIQTTHKSKCQIHASKQRKNLESHVTRRTAWDHFFRSFYCHILLWYFTQYIVWTFRLFFNKTTGHIHTKPNNDLSIGSQDVLLRGRRFRGVQKPENQIRLNSSCSKYS